MIEEFHVHPPDLVMIAGTSALFPYIVEPLVSARAAGKLTLEINPEETTATRLVEFMLPGTADSYLPLIERALAR